MSEVPVKYDVNIVCVHKMSEKMEMSRKQEEKSKKIADESMKKLSGRLGINTIKSDGCTRVVLSCYRVYYFIISRFV